eukprot:7076714-Pyramimonas_sp.AAC.1
MAYGSSRTAGCGMWEAKCEKREGICKLGLFVEQYPVLVDEVTHPNAAILKRARLKLHQSSQGGISEEEFFTDLFPFVAELASAIDAQLIQSAQLWIVYLTNVWWYGRRQACRDHTIAIAHQAGGPFKAEWLGEENLESNHFEIRQLPSGHCGTVWITQASIEHSCGVI